MINIISNKFYTLTLTQEQYKKLIKASNYIHEAIKAIPYNKMSDLLFEFYYMTGGDLHDEVKCYELIEDFLYFNKRQFDYRGDDRFQFFDFRDDKVTMTLNEHQFFYLKHIIYHFTEPLELKNYKGRAKNVTDLLKEFNELEQNELIEELPCDKYSFKVYFVKHVFQKEEKTSFIFQNVNDYYMDIYNSLFIFDELYKELDAYENRCKITDNDELPF